MTLEEEIEKLRAELSDLNGWAENEPDIVHLLASHDRLVAALRRMIDDHLPIGDMGADEEQCCAYVKMATDALAPLKEQV